MVKKYNFKQLCVFDFTKITNLIECINQTFKQKSKIDANVAILSLCVRNNI